MKKAVTEIKALRGYAAGLPCHLLLVAKNTAEMILGPAAITSAYGRTAVTFM